MGLCGQKQGTVFHHVIFVGTQGGEAGSAGKELSSFEGLRPLPRISKWQVEIYLCSHTEREGLVLETCPVLSDLGARCWAQREAGFTTTAQRGRV